MNPTFQRKIVTLFEKIKECNKTMDKNFRQLMEDKLRIEELDLAIG